jgi:hypothetical protein
MQLVGGGGGLLKFCRPVLWPAAHKRRNNEGADRECSVFHTTDQTSDVPKYEVQRSAVYSLCLTI